MSDLDARLDAARAAIDAMAPPQDLWEQVLERADTEAGVLDLPVTTDRRRVSRWFAAGAVAACLCLLAAIVVADRDTQVTTDSASPSDDAVGHESTTTDSTPPSPHDDGDQSTVFAEDVKIVGLDGRLNLDIDVGVQGDEATGQFRAEGLGVDGIVVTVQCAGTRTSTGARLDQADLILGGEVTVNDAGLTMLDEVGVTVGDRLALIIRQDVTAGQRVTFYEPSLYHGEPASAGSCDELVESVPSNLDGGFFNDIAGTIRTP